MQKLSVKYIFTKLILFFLLTLTGACLGVLFLQIAKSSELDPRISRGIAGGLGMIVYVILQYRIMQGAKLDGISKKDYLIGECLAILIYLAIAGAVCSLCGELSLYFGWKTVLFLPVLPFVYLFENLYIGLAAQLVLFCAVTVVFYEIKRRTDPLLLGRTKNQEQN